MLYHIVSRLSLLAIAYAAFVMVIQPELAAMSATLEQLSHAIAH